MSRRAIARRWEENRRKSLITFLVIAGAALAFAFLFGNWGNQPPEIQIISLNVYQPTIGYDLEIRVFVKDPDDSKFTYTMQVLEGDGEITPKSVVSNKRGIFTYSHGYLAGEHKFRATVKDSAGNMATRSFTVTFRSK